MVLEHQQPDGLGERCVAIWNVLLEVWTEDLAVDTPIDQVGINYVQAQNRSGVGMGHLRHPRGPLDSIAFYCEGVIPVPLPPFTVLVVKTQPQRNRRPGGGYVIRYGSLRADREAVMAFDWAAVAVPDPGDFHIRPQP